METTKETEMTAGAVQVGEKSDRRKRRLSIILHSGDMDKAYAALILANGAASMGMEAAIFFTFWGLTLLTRGGLAKAPLSRMHMAGLGKKFMASKMTAQNVMSLDELLKSALALGVKLIPCEMTMGVMGIKPDSLIDGLEDVGGVVTFLNHAKDADISLFI